MKKKMMVFSAISRIRPADSGAAKAAPTKMAAVAQETLNLAWVTRTSRRGLDQQKSMARDNMLAVKTAGRHNGKEQAMM